MVSTFANCLSHPVSWLSTPTQRRTGHASQQGCILCDMQVRRHSLGDPAAPYACIITSPAVTRPPSSYFARTDFQPTGRMIPYWLRAEKYSVSGSGWRYPGTSSVGGSRLRDEPRRPGQRAIHQQRGAGSPAANEPDSSGHVAQFPFTMRQPSISGARSRRQRTTGYSLLTAWKPGDQGNRNNLHYSTS